MTEADMVITVWGACAGALAPSAAAIGPAVGVLWALCVVVGPSLVGLTP